MTQDVHALLHEAGELKNVTLTANMLPEGAGNIICTAWPTAKHLLEAVRDLVKNPVVKISITAIISLIDGIYNKMCGKQ